MIIPIRQIRRLIDAYAAELIVPEGHELVLQVDERDWVIRVHAVKSDSIGPLSLGSDEAVLGGRMIHRAEIPVAEPGRPFMVGRVG